MGADDPRDFTVPATQRKAADPVPSNKDDQAAGPEITHDLLLTDGTTYESSGSIPSHIAVGDRTIAVLSVTER